MSFVQWGAVNLLGGASTGLLVIKSDATNFDQHGTMDIRLDFNVGEAGQPGHTEIGSVSAIAPAPTAGTPVPEPSTAVGFFVGGMFWLIKRARRG